MPSYVLFEEPPPPAWATMRPPAGLGAVGNGNGNGWWGEVTGWFETVGGWVSGAAGAARNAGQWIGGMLNNPDLARQWEGYLAAAQSVADQVLRFHQMLSAVEQARGRKLTDEERRAAETRVFGPGGLPSLPSLDRPAVSPQFPVIPILIIGGAFLLGKKSLPLVALAGVAWWYLGRQGSVK